MSAAATKLPGDVGPIRQYCEAVDYRFARISRSKSHMLNPFIYRGPLYDLQVWLPAVKYPGADLTQQLAQLPAGTKSTSYNIVVKKIPLMTWLWVGLSLSLFAGIYYAVFSRRKISL